MSELDCGCGGIKRVMFMPHIGMTARHPQMADCRERLRARDFRNSASFRPPPPPPPASASLLAVTANLLSFRDDPLTCDTATNSLSWTSYHSEINHSSQYGQPWTTDANRAAGGSYILPNTTKDDVKSFLWQVSGSTLLASGVEVSANLTLGVWNLVAWDDCAEMLDAETFRLTAMRDVTSTTINIARGVVADQSSGAYIYTHLNEVWNATNDSEAYPSNSASGRAYNYAMSIAY